MRIQSIGHIVSLTLFDHLALSMARSLSIDSRDRLLKLLDEVTTPDLSNSTVPTISAFLESESRFLSMIGSSGGGGDSGPPRRRVNPHSACECPEESDTLTKDCMQLRVGLVRDSFHQATDANSPELLRRSLRVAAYALSEQVDQLRNKTQFLYDRIYKGLDEQKSYLVSADDQAAALRRVSEHMVECMNTHWTQSFVLDDLSLSEAESVRQKVLSTLVAVVKWFNDIQLQEEAISNNNLVQTLSLANEQMKQTMNEVNRAQGSVQKSFELLQADMKNGEKTDTKLINTLTDAGDRLEEAIQTFIEAAHNNLDNTRIAIEEKSYPNFLANFKTNVDNLIQQMRSVTSAKVRDETTLGSKTIIDQGKTVKSKIIEPARAALAAEVSAVRKLDEDFQAKSDRNREALFRIIDSVLDSKMGWVNSLVASNREKVFTNNAAIVTVNDRLTGYKPDFDRLMAASKTAMTSIEATVNADLQDILTNLVGTKTKQSMDSASEAVGSAKERLDDATRAQIDHMEQEAVRALQDYVMEDHSEASKSMGVSNDIDVAYSNFVSRMNAGASEVNNQIFRSFGNILDKTMTLIPTLDQAGISPHDIRATVQEKKGNITDRVTVSAMTVQRRSADEMADVEARLAQVVQTVLGSSLTTKEKTDRVQAAITHLNSYRESLGWKVPSTGQTAASQVAESASQVGNAEDRLDKLATEFVKQLAQTPSFVYDPEVFGTGKAAGMVEKVTAAIEGASIQEGSAMSDLKDKADAAKLTVEQSKNTVDMYSADVQGALLADGDEGRQRIQEILSHAARSRASTVIDHLRAIRNVGHNVRLSIGRLGVADLEAIERTVAETDALLSQMNAWLGAQIPVLYNEMGSIGTRANKGGILGDMMSNSVAKFADMGDRSVKMWKSDSADTIQAFSAASDASNETLAVVNETVLRDMILMPATYTGRVAELLTRYGQEEDSLKDKLDQAVKEMGSSYDQDMIKIDQAVITDKLDVAKKKFDTVRAAGETAVLTSDNVIPAPKDIDKAVTGVRQIMTDQDTVATEARSAVNNVAADASSSLSTTRANIQDVIKQLKNDAETTQASSELESGIKINEVAKKSKSVSQIGTDFASVVADYKQLDTAQQAESDTHPELVYNDIIKVRAQTSAALSRMASAAANGQDQTLKESTADTAMIKAVVGASISNIYKVFELFKTTFGSGAQLAQARLVFDQAVDTILAAAGRELDKRDADLKSREYKIRSSMSEVASQLEDLTGSDESMDRQIEYLKDQVGSWAKAKTDELAQLKQEAARMSITSPDIDSVIRSEMVRLIGTVESTMMGEAPLPKRAGLQKVLDQVRGIFRIPVPVRAGNQ